jgi:hypothetical protein
LNGEIYSINQTILNMKSYFGYVVIFLLCISLTSCEVVGGIFKGGMWTGAILVIGVIVIVVWALAKAFGGGGKS